jgi:tRNA modification GTPase
LGNVLKHGVNTVIAGKPNAGKSTLLNTLLNEERAIVSDIPGTTRDTIEEILNLRGIQFRFIDTAGIRTTTDLVEKAGVERAMEKLKQSSVYIYLFDVNTTTPLDLLHDVQELKLTEFKGLIVGNKIDQAPKWSGTAPFYWILKNHPSTHAINLHQQLLFISSLKHTHIDTLKDRLYHLATGNKQLATENTIISNMRHYEALVKASQSLIDAKNALQNNLTGELISFDLKRGLEYLGEISGEVTNEEILGNIFGKFCIGK